MGAHDIENLGKKRANHGVAIRYPEHRDIVGITLYGRYYENICATCKLEKCPAIIHQPDALPLLKSAKPAQQIREMRIELCARR